MRYLDDELPPDRRVVIEAHIRDCTECNRDHAVFKRMKGDLHSMAMENDHGPSLWQAVSRRLFRPTGWVLLVIGTVALTAWGIYSYITSPENVWTKLATGAVVIGIALLLLSAIVDRRTALRTDRYREIQR
jgi:anti-sigma factor RsiW